MTKKRQPPASLRGYAKRRGVSANAVSKAIKDGRLRASVVVVDGAPKIADVELADREWDANTRPRIDQPAPPRARRPAPTDESADDADEAVELPVGIPPYKVSRARREAAAARREEALADIAQMEAAEKSEDLVPFEEARTYIIDKFTVVKTRLLGVPSRVAQRLPQVASEVEPVVDELIREVLEEIAAEDDDGGEDEEE